MWVIKWAYDLQTGGGPHQVIGNQETMYLISHLIRSERQFQNNDDEGETGKILYIEIEEI